jgi:hypothetical protein
MNETLVPLAEVLRDRIQDYEILIKYDLLGKNRGIQREQERVSKA